ncbi:PH domain-containing protein [Taibaiella soli]|uniref:GLUE N-terminal domain-containing protein n=1 Tax=Taibaiella soli TaxID=1649169 RepID=A0A2W2B4G2_9BACT|nr:hypothetical protein [Taibaiella soli]PZF74948.1 hypothetical protein DN068_01755 [Taibaiella soli]
MKKIFQLPLQQDERIVKNEPATRLDDNGEQYSGKLVLTTLRLLWGNDTAHDPAINIDLDTINKIERKSQLVDNSVLSVTYLQYQEVRFSVLDYEAWEEAIEETRMTPNI